MKFFLFILFALVLCVIGGSIKNPVNAKYNKINKEMLSKRMETEKKIKSFLGKREDTDDLDSKEINAIKSEDNKEEAVDDRFLRPNCGYNVDVNFLICDDYNDKYKFYCQCGTFRWRGREARAFGTPDLCDVLENYCCNRNDCGAYGRKLNADSISESEHE